MASSIASIPYRRANNSVSSLFAATSTPPGSRSISPNGGSAPPKGLAGSVFAGAPAGDIPDVSVSDRLENPRHLILQAFVPHIAIHTSVDTDELTNDKGFSHGLWQLLRPFGEHVQGKVTVRDSNGASRICEDFAVRFVQLGDGLERPRLESGGKGPESQATGLNGNPISKDAQMTDTFRSSRTGGDIEMIENVVDRHLSYAERLAEVNMTTGQSAVGPNALSPFFILYLRRLLSGIPLAPHETFSHPVACIIAISSRNPNPIETLRRLYDESSRGEKRLPPWVNGEYLRYYVLVHDEERDDIGKSMALFEQMKRHFGLHCHLLRLRSSQCIPTDDDSIQLPKCEWISAAEELAEIESRDVEEDVEDTYPYIFESDVTAIRTFIREMVTQSVVPSMERCVSTWNDQVASRRRGISGRFISLSKKWTGFGTTSRAGAGGTGTGAKSNFDALQGFYRPDAPEAVMRKLADYAFMLRDWKLAYSTYELLRSDFNNDKAWEYHAATNEMAAVSTMLIPQAISSKTRSETVDQMLDTAAYSYITRCGDSYGALRCLILGMELLRLRGASSTDDAAIWGSKLLESKIVGSVGDALIKERVSICYATRKGTGLGAWGARTRKAALWNVLAADGWLNLGKYVQAERRLTEVRSLYSKLANHESLSQFSEADAFLANLEREVQLASSPVCGRDREGLTEDEAASSMDEESEALDLRSHRKSLIGATVPPLASLGTAPLRSLSADDEYAANQDDDFE